MADAAQVIEQQDEQTPPQDDQKQAQDVELSEAADTENTTQSTSIDVLLDLNVPVTAVIDKVEISIQRLLQLGPGSVLRLRKTVDAPIDLYLKDVKFATATVVVIDDTFAVRIKEILNPGATAATQKN
ncbi:MAG: FliM/FliN family flagellar motor switch protein [Sedimentisphaerales bacterium]|nr:FliM/FliN family flagellar motor switch protein [Sedimentisphaerales bacterium]